MLLPLFLEAAAAAAAAACTSSSVAQGGRTPAGRDTLLERAGAGVLVTQPGPAPPAHPGGKHARVKGWV